ncbi:hypothetical protein KAR91_64290 [Candidatus Pacearchaeota archaeon]|nr:hypothetical protein [Candidatus Pacearchaeota archaeon]
MKWKVSKKGERWESHEFKGKSLRMSVHHHIHHEPKEWVLSCFDVFGSRQISLGEVDIETAKIEAVARVEVRLLAMLSDID